LQKIGALEKHLDRLERFVKEARKLLSHFLAEGFDVKIVVDESAVGTLTVAAR
jgi:hypothetical protein